MRARKECCAQPIYRIAQKVVARRGPLPRKRSLGYLRRANASALLLGDDDHEATVLNTKLKLCRRLLWQGPDERTRRSAWIHSLVLLSIPAPVECRCEHQAVLTQQHLAMPRGDQRVGQKCNGAPQKSQNMAFTCIWKSGLSRAIS